MATQNIGPTLSNRTNPNLDASAYLAGFAERPVGHYAYGISAWRLVANEPAAIVCLGNIERNLGPNHATVHSADDV